MLLTEMFSDQNSEYQDLTKDNSQKKITDLRKTRLTLAQISQLRKMNDQRNLEKQEDLSRVRKQYGAPAAPPA
jgi:hypothetical protein